MLSLQKNNQFFIQKSISILHVKWTGMNKGEQVEILKFWVNIDKFIEPNALTNSQNFSEWNKSIIYVKFEMWSSSFMWIPHLIFYSEA